MTQVPFEFEVHNSEGAKLAYSDRRLKFLMIAIIKPSLVMGRFFVRRRVQEWLPLPYANCVLVGFEKRTNPPVFDSCSADF